MFKKYFLLFCTVAMMPLYSYADETLQPVPALKVANPTSTLFTDIAKVQDQLIAVGKHGTIVLSDNGLDWQQADSPVQALLTAVTFVDENRGWACGHDATILNTKDAGRTWQIQNYDPISEVPCLDIAFFSPQHGIAVGAYGMYYETKDSGLTWNKRFIESFVHPDDIEYLAELKQDDYEAYKEETAFILPHFNRVFVDGERVYLVGEMGLVAKSDDKGQSWEKFEEFYPGSFFDVAKTNKNELIVAGLRGNAFVLKEDVFQSLDLGKTATINSILPSDNGITLFANSGVIFKFTNGKVHSTQLENGRSILSAVAFKNTFILATEQGIQTYEVSQ